MSGLPDFYKQFFRYFNYEIREPVDNLSSFVIGDNNLLYPVGIGGITKKTFVIIEIRDTEIVDNAKFIFDTAWKKAKPIFKVKDSKISME